MSFADPQTITISGAGNTLPRVSSGLGTGVFKKDDGLVTLSVSHQYAKRIRRNIRLDHSKIAADPLIAAQNLRYSMSAYLVVDQPLVGYTVAEAVAVIAGLTTYLTASSNAKTTQLLGGEN